MSLFLISIYLHLFLFSSLQQPAAGGAQPDECKPVRCGRRGPIIQFPFRHAQKQPDRCGFPGFDLYCDDSGKTLLQLSPQNVTVESILYESQSIYASDPDNCLFRKIQLLNLSASPFQFETSFSDYVLFNCSAPSGNIRNNNIPCLDGSYSQIYAVSVDASWDEFDLVSCTRIHKVSVPYAAFDSTTRYLPLEWKTPNCTHCAATGRRCYSNSSAAQGNHFLCMAKEPKHGTPNARLIAGATLGACTSVAILGALFNFIRSVKQETAYQKTIEKFLQDYKAVKPTRFSYSDLTKITNQFTEKLGEGGFGVVYKGKISKEMTVAVKVLNNSKGNGEDFVNEIGTMGRVHHVNVVRLVGFCAEGYRRALVYEFLPNNSLEKFIFQDGGGKKDSQLGWNGLFDIALGIAKGIEYLHQGCDQQILHFDIKPHNILLDRDYNPKISDFGLAKWCSKEQSAVTMTAARGTAGYIAPEVLNRTFGKVSYKSDIYSYGMLLLEIVGGRKNVDPGADTSQIHFPQWIFKQLDDVVGEEFWGRVEEDDEDGNVARKIAMVGLWCIQWHPVDRPSMKQVVQMLEGETNDLTMPPNPFPAQNMSTEVVESVEQIVGSRYQANLPVILEALEVEVEE